MEAGKVLVIYTGGTIGMKTNIAKECHHETIGIILNKAGINNRFDYKSTSRIVDSSQLDYRMINEILSIIETGYEVYEGFLIISGTDTMAYLQSCLKWLIKGLKKPIVITGSMRTYEEDSDEGAGNLKTSMELLKMHKSEGIVGIVMNNNIMTGGCTKNSSLDKNPFIESKDSSLEMLRLKMDSTTNKTKFYRIERHDIELVYLHPFLNIEDSPLKDGLLVVVYGQGTIMNDEALIRRLKAYEDENRPIVIVSQARFNSLDFHQYEAGSILKDIDAVSGKGAFIEEGIGILCYLIQKN